MKRTLHTILLLLVATITFAQSYPRKCTEEEIPSSARVDYYNTVGRYLSIYYQMLPISIGGAENRAAIIDNVMANPDGVTLKTEFLLNPAKNLSFISPDQYYVKFENEFGQMADEVEFAVDNCKFGDIMMSNLVSCYIPVDYDLTAKKGDEVLFKRRCRMTFLFQKVSISSIAKTMQVEPLNDIIAYQPKAGNKKTTRILRQRTSVVKKAYGIENILSEIKSHKSNPYIYNSLHYKYNAKDEKKFQKTWNQMIHGTGKAPTKALETMFDLAEKGMPEALLYLGNRNYSLGDYAGAFYSYQAATLSRNPEAMVGLANIYYYGLYVRQDYKKSFVLYKEAAEKDTKTTAFELGLSYFEGHGTEQDIKKAYECYVTAADNGNADAMAELGYFYDNGYIVKKNSQKAAELYLKSATAGSSRGMYRWGNNQEGTEEGLKWWKRAADLGHTDAMNSLGCNAFDKKDFKTAHKWFSKAAEKNNLYAMANLGVIYKNGYGFEQDLNVAEYWYKNAAEQGYIVAIKNLANLYYYNKKDFEKAFTWYLKGAYKNDVYCQTSVAYSYWKAEGTKKSEGNAIDWWLTAALKGDETSKKNLEELNKSYKAPLIRIPMDSGQYKGIVYDESDKPVADAFVYVLDTDIVSKTNSEGHFFIKGVEDDTKIRAGKLGTQIIKIEYIDDKKNTKRISYRQK